jgi:hypothetical protein
MRSRYNPRYGAPGWARRLDYDDMMDEVNGDDWGEWDRDQEMMDDDERDDDDELTDE